MKTKRQNDYEAVCALCEHMTYLELSGDYICKYKNSLKCVKPDYSCSRFRLDLLNIEPKQARPSFVDIKSIV